MKNLIRTFIAPYFAFAASICSIVGIVVILLSSKKAIFERKLIDQEIDAEFEYIESIEFNSLYKQYYHVVVDPAPGYIYRIRWKK